MPYYRFTISVRQDFSRYYIADIISRLCFRKWGRPGFLQTKCYGVGKSVMYQGRSSTKVVGRGAPKSRKNVGLHGWPTEKILNSEWPKTAQMSLKFLCFFYETFLNMFRIFLACQNNFCEKKFLQGLFSWKSRKWRKVQFKMTPCRLYTNFYIKSFSEGSNTVDICLWKSI